MFPSQIVGAGANKYLLLLQSLFTQELMLIVPFPTKDNGQILSGFIVQDSCQHLCEAVLRHSGSKIIAKLHL